jgi:hypothetical protein
MLDTAIDSGLCGEIDDIESELCASSREASVGFVPFANLDIWDLVRKVALSQTGHDLRAPWRRCEAPDSHRTTQ